MKYVLIALFGLVYLIGIFTVKVLDQVLPENLRESRSHYLVLILMWIMTPILLVMFFGYKLRSTIIK